MPLFLAIRLFFAKHTLSSSQNLYVLNHFCLPSDNKKVRRKLIQSLKTKHCRATMANSRTQNSLVS